MTNSLTLKHLRLHERLGLYRADQQAWRELARFHYRPGRPGAVDKVFALRYLRDERADAWRELTGERRAIVGVIIYSMPLRQCELRNFATRGRYTALPGPEAVRLVNAELRTISRVVIHPALRGIGLARRLVEQTLPLAGTELVEALAAMGRVNPFFEKAGMTRYQGPESPAAVRLKAALAAAGVDKSGNHKELAAAVAGLDEDGRRWCEREMRRMVRDSKSLSLQELAQAAVRAVNLRPVYYLWQRTGLSRGPEHFRFEP